MKKKSMFNLVFSYVRNDKVDNGNIVIVQGQKSKKDKVEFEDLILKYLMKDIFPDSDKLDRKIGLLGTFVKENLAEMQIMNLDIRSKKTSPTFSDIINSPEMNNKMPNVAFIFRCDKNIDDTKLNTIVLFCSIISNKESASEEIRIKINRLEFLYFEELPSVLHSYGAHELDISFSSGIYWMDLRDGKYDNLPEMFKKIQKASSSRKDKEEFDSIFKFNEWYDFILAYNQYLTSRVKDDYDWVINLSANRFIEKDFKKNKILIGLSSDKQLNDSKKLCIIDANDQNNIIPILVKNQNAIDLIGDFEQEVLNIKTEIQKIADEIDQLNVDKLKLAKESKSLTKEQKEISVIEQENKNIENWNFSIHNNQKQLQAKKETKDNINKKILNDISKDNQEKKQKNENLIKDLKKEIDNCEKQIITYDNEISHLVSQIKESKNSIDIICKKFNLSLNNYQNKLKNIANYITDISSETKKIDKKIEKLNDDNIKLEQKLASIEINLDNLSEKNFTKIIECDVIPNYRDGDKKISITLPELRTNKWLYYVDNVDKGAAAKIWRFRHSFDNAKQGFYRNPYFLYSLFMTPEYTNDSDIDLSKYINKYNCNEKQEEAIYNAIATRDCFYLQGPPGTGKTQVIAAIAEYACDKDQNVIITSSTHEAISNFFDRLNNNNLDNPNLILYKTIAKGDNYDYGQETMFNEFINKICKFACKSESDDQKIKEWIEDYKKKYGSSLLLEVLTDAQIDCLIQELKDDIDISYINEYKLLPETYTYNVVDNNDFIDCLEDYRESRMRRNRISKNDQQVELANQIFKWVINNNKSFKSIKNIDDIKLSKNTLPMKNRLLLELSTIISKKRNNEQSLDDNSVFLNYINENKLINVIGITTTAKPSISILDLNINLFTEYPIDLVIIDEISKSTTPEIISRGIFAKKVIFAGDYRQLPPSCDIDPNEAGLLFKSSDFSEFNIKYNLKDSEQFINFVDKKLFCTSFFAEQVKKIKQNNKKKSYGFLNVQHRFNENINKVVNVFYPEEEKLLLPYKEGSQDRSNHISEFNNYSLKFNKQDFQDDFLIYDTSYFSHEYIDLLKKEKIEISSSDETFDQKDIVLFSDVNLNKGIVNEYNAMSVCKIVKNIINNNKNVNLNNKIGIIAMVRNQVRIISRMLQSENFGIGNEKYQELKIKVDTVDNFQGREKDIIIVDFIRSKNRLDKSSKKFWEQKNPNIDFIKSPERINVAVSRAKSKLILVGAFESFLNKIISKIDDQEVKAIKDIYNIANKNDWIVKASEQK